jgi:hypothetical protein
VYDCVSPASAAVDSDVIITAIKPFVAVFMMPPLTELPHQRGGWWNEINQ